MRLISDKPPGVAWTIFCPEIKFKLTSLLERSQAGLDKRNPLIFDLCRSKAFSRYNHLQNLKSFGTLKQTALPTCRASM